MIRIQPPIVVVIALLGLALPCAGQFFDPIQVSSGAAGFSQASIASDSADNISLAFQKDGQIYFSSTQLGFPGEIAITSGQLQRAHPRVAAGALGVISIVYEEESTVPGGVGNDIVYINNSGGSFGPAIHVTLSEIDDQRPRVVSNPLGSEDVVWSRITAGGASEVLVSLDLFSGVVLAPGHSPVIASTTDGEVHVAYLREGFVYYRRTVGGIFEPEAVLSSYPGQSSGLVMDADSGDTLHIAFVNAGVIYYQSGSSGVFDIPVPLDFGPVDGDPELAAGAAGETCVVYAIGGQILYRDISGGIIGTPETVTPPSSTAARPAVALDSHGYAHIAFEENGAIFFTNNVPPPVADFTTSSVTTGEVPLEIEFENLSTGLINQVEWDFGDGETSNLMNPTHTYTTAGDRTVTLTVIGPGGSDTEVKDDFVVAMSATNILRVSQISVFPSQQGIVQPILASSDYALQGFVLAMTWDDTITDIDEVTLQGTVTTTLDPEFVVVNFNSQGVDSWFILAVIIDAGQPFDGRTIPPGVDQPIASLHYQIPIGIPLGTEGMIVFQDNLGDPPVSNIFNIDGGFSVHPLLIDGGATIDSQPQVTFIRGDSNGDLVIDISDAISLLSYLFSSGTAPFCLDAADANDSGMIDLSDAIFLLTLLFAGGAAPPYPYPFPGIDPTPDGLGPCNP